MTNTNYLIEYGKECELLEKTDEGYKVKIYGKNEVTEKIVQYEPIPNFFKYSGVLVERDGKYSRLEKYTTYLQEGKLVYAYKKHDITRYSDDMVYETEIDSAYKVVEVSPFLDRDKIEALSTECFDEKKPILDTIKKLKDQIASLEKEVSEIEKKYDTKNKCGHIWEENGEEEYNKGRSTKRFYICSICEKEDTHYWHSL